MSSASNANALTGKVASEPFGVLAFERFLADVSDVFTAFASFADAATIDYLAILFRVCQYLNPIASNGCFCQQVKIDAFYLLAWVGFGVSRYAAGIMASASSIRPARFSRS